MARFLRLIAAPVYWILILGAFGVAIYEWSSNQSLFGLNSSYTQFLIVAFTFEVGHVALTYVMLLSDRVLRAEFPWKRFALFASVLFGGLWYFGTYQNVVVALVATKVFTVLRVYHSTHQAFGLSMLELHRRQEVSKPLLKLFRQFLLIVLGIALINPFFNLVKSVYPEFNIPPLGLYICLSIFLLGLFVHRILKTEQPLSPGNLVLGRMTALPLKSGASFGLAKAIHGFEFFYVFFRYSSHPENLRRRKALLAIGIASIVSVQALFIFVHRRKLGFGNEDSSRLLWAFVYTLIVSHIVQDYILFNRNKLLSARIRAVLMGRS